MSSYFLSSRFLTVLKSPSLIVLPKIVISLSWFTVSKNFAGSTSIIRLCPSFIISNALVTACCAHLTGWKPSTLLLHFPLPGHVRNLHPLEPPMAHKPQKTLEPCVFPAFCFFMRLELHARLFCDLRDGTTGLCEVDGYFKLVKYALT